MGRGVPRIPMRTAVSSPGPSTRLSWCSTRPGSWRCWTASGSSTTIPSPHGPSPQARQACGPAESSTSSAIPTGQPRTSSRRWAHSKQATPGSPASSKRPAPRTSCSTRPHSATSRTRSTNTCARQRSSSGRQAPTAAIHASPSFPPSRPAHGARRTSPSPRPPSPTSASARPWTTTSSSSAATLWFTTASSPTTASAGATCSPGGRRPSRSPTTPRGRRPLRGASAALRCAPQRRHGEP